MSGVYNDSLSYEFAKFPCLRLMELAYLAYSGNAGAPLNYLFFMLSLNQINEHPSCI